MEGSNHEQADLPVIALECHICLTPPTNPVATSCGHLFCWPCLYLWRQDQAAKPCPVCRTVVRKDINIIPIYGSHEVGSNDAGSADPDEDAASDSVIPPRPNPPSPPIAISMDDSDQFISGSLLAVTTLMQINEHNERSRIELRLALEAERERVNVLRRERRQLRQNVNHLRRRNYVLIQEAEERTRRQVEERHAFLNSLRVHIARLEGLVATQENHLL